MLILLQAGCVSWVVFSFPVQAFLLINTLVFLALSVVNLFRNRKLLFGFVLIAPLSLLLHAFFIDNGNIHSNPDSSAILWTLFLLFFVFAAYLVFYGILLLGWYIRKKNLKEGPPRQD